MGRFEKFVLVALVVANILSVKVFSQAAFPLSVHLLDNVDGGNAPGVSCTLYKLVSNAGDFEFVATDVTDSNGRIPALVSANDFVTGTYRLTADIKSYYNANNVSTFWAVWQMTFVVRNTTVDRHLPVGFAPYAFQTYRGT